MNQQLKTMDGWRASGLTLYGYLLIGDRIDEELQNYFLTELPPIRGGGYTQLGEPYSSNENGHTYLSIYGDLFLGDINDVRGHPAFAHGRRKLAEETALKNAALASEAS